MVVTGSPRADSTNLLGVEHEESGKKLKKKKTRTSSVGINRMPTRFFFGRVLCSLFPTPMTPTYLHGTFGSRWLPYVQDMRRQFQPCTSAQTNPTPCLTLTLTPTLWGTRGRQGQSRGSAACFGGVFIKKTLSGRRPALTNKIRILH